MTDQINELVFSEHPSAKLKSAYKGYQGCNPSVAHIIILGRDPYFIRDIEQSPVFNELIAYLETGVDFYIDKPGIKYFRHHPFLSAKYSRGDLWRYHSNFRRIFGKCPDGKFLNNKDYDDYRNWARKTSMVELIGTPTCGMSQVNSKFTQVQADYEYQKMLTGAQNSDHLLLIQSLLFDSAKKTIFITKEAYSILRTMYPKLKIAFPNDSYTIETLYTNQSNTNIKSLRHPSASIKEDYFDQLKNVMLKALLN